MPHVYSVRYSVQFQQGGNGRNLMKCVLLRCSTYRHTQQKCHRVLECTCASLQGEKLTLEVSKKRGCHVTVPCAKLVLAI